MKTWLTWLTAWAACLLLAACGAEERRTVLNAFRPVPTDGWEHGDTLTFAVDSIRQSGTYDFELQIRTTPAFPFQKLWLVVDREFAHPDTLLRDTVGCLVATPEGNITGDGISLHTYAYPLPALPLQAGQYGRIVVSHIMRNELLPGVSDVGIRITRR